MQEYRRQTDDELVAAFASGDNQAFDVLLERHQRRIFNYIMHIIKDADLANDIFQDAFVKVITTIKQGRYSADGKFVSWVIRIVHNNIIDYYRQEKSENTVSTDESDYDLLNRRELCDATIEDALVDTAIRDDIRQMVRALPREQRQVLVMRYYGNMSFKEIAERTGVGINTALGRMRYAIINLRRIAEENHITLTR
ncbi:MAG: sigma-70 family RNA polymerase sigma factor [Bacteroidales bacterium]|nr:sigma-70 family RNA polymerase sigma factor [Bacteroidales bacterium]